VVLQDVIGRYPDLVQGFNHFLNRCETMESFDVDLRNISNSVRLPKDMGRMKAGSARYFCRGMGMHWLPA
jgi:hypothetical protein